MKLLATHLISVVLRNRYYIEVNLTGEYYDHSSSKT
jgi:hypothetical protein